MTDYEQRLLADALSKACLAKLPSRMDTDNLVWLEGVCKIRLLDGSVGYGIAKRNPDLTYAVTYVNGATSPILRVEEVYPYSKIDGGEVKKFSGKDDRAARVAYLRSLRLPYEIDYEAGIAELNREVVKAAVYRRLNAGGGTA